MSFRFISATLIWATLSTIGQTISPDRPRELVPSAAADPYVKAFGLQQIQIDSLRVFYGPALQGELDQVKRIFSDFSQRVGEHQRQIEKTRAQTDAILQEVNRLVGWQPDTNLTQLQHQTFDFYLTNSGGLMLRNARIYLVAPAEIRKHLSAGGHLPNLKFNPDTKEATFEFKRGSLTKDRPTEDGVMLVLPAETPAGLAVALANLLPGLLNAGQEVAFLKVVQSAILTRLEPRHAYDRWFYDGFANAITERLLDRFAGNEAAKKFADSLSPVAFQSLESSVQLRFWMAATYSVETDFEPEGRLTQARYAFATLEARRLMEKHGPETLKKTLDLIVAERTPNFKPNDFTEPLLKYLQRVAGEDVGARLQRYQPFQTIDEGLKLYQGRLDAALEQYQTGAALTATLRAIEVSGAQSSSPPMEAYPSVARFLHLLGRTDEGIRVLQKPIEASAQGNVAELGRRFRQLLVEFAWFIGRPEIGESAAAELLKENPRDVSGLSMRMFRLDRDNQPVEARDVAEQIVKAASNEESSCKAFAEFILGAHHAQGKGIEKDLAQARVWFERAAEHGYAVAARNLGEFYLNGEGVSRDASAAIQWLTKAAHLGDLQAHQVLGALYSEAKSVKQDRPKAFQHTSIAANGGHAQAQYDLAIMCAKGEGTLTNLEQSLDWLRKAAERGHGPAARTLAAHYMSGQGLTRDPARAIEWLTKAASAGDLEAHRILGGLYLRGQNVELDEKKALHHTSVAANGGDAQAQYNLGIAYLLGKGVPEDVEQALNWLRKSAEQGDWDAQHNLGVLYSTGEKVKQDMPEAVRWLEKAAEQGQLADQITLARIYYRGEGVPKDIPKAIVWFEKAALQRDAVSQFVLGNLLYLGKETPQDLIAAYKWSALAAAAGHKEADKLRRAVTVDLSPSDLAKAVREFSALKTKIEKDRR